MSVRLLRELAVSFLLHASTRAITQLPSAVWAAPGFAAGPWLLYRRWQEPQRRVPGLSRGAASHM